jgi:ABC-type transport system substrate-binding protein
VNTFKKGDRVVVVKAANRLSPPHVGVHGTIKGPPDAVDGMYTVALGTSYILRFHPNELELLSPTSSVAEAKKLLESKGYTVRPPAFKPIKLDRGGTLTTVTEQEVIIAGKKSGFEFVMTHAEIAEIYAASQKAVEFTKNHQ